MQTLNREAYLNFITDNYIRDHFKSRGYTIPDNVRMSCSLTSTKKAIGQCWSSLNSADNHFEIFISPKVADSVEVIDILIHELVHATVGIKAGHKAPFKACALAVGLEGKMTSASAGDVLKATIQAWVDEAGQYPHAPLTQSGIKKQSTRMLKCACQSCGYQVYTSRKWIELALPVCPDYDCEKYGSSMTVELPDESEGE
jgi:hypothetical protein